MCIYCIEFNIFSADCYDGDVQYNHTEGYDIDAYYVQLTVSICRNGEYTPVCSDGWDVADAIVACHDQGYSPPQYGVFMVIMCMYLCEDNEEVSVLYSMVILLCETYNS